MLKNKYFFRPRGILVLLLVVVCWSAAAGAGRLGWQRRRVDWRMTGGSRIKAISYPREKPLPLLTERGKRRPRIVRKETLGAEAASRLAPLAQEATTSVIANVVDSPPIDGFIPLIAVAVTDKRFPEIDSRFDAVDTNSIVGNYLTSNPEDDYAIGIFDTGASAHVMGNSAAIQAGLFSADLITSNTIELIGVTGSVDAWVSQPIGVFIDGLSAIGPDGLDDSNMVGEWNVAIAVGMGSSPNDLPTAVGSPLSAYFTSVINTGQEVTITHNGQQFTGPDMHFYKDGDPCIPDYSNIIPLELRPLGGFNAQYLPTLNEITLEFEPSTPSIIVTSLGDQSQSVFFVHSVDLYDGDKKAIDKDRFMFDTGAQVSTVGSRIATRLRLDPD